MSKAECLVRLEDGACWFPVRSERAGETDEPRTSEVPTLEIRELPYKSVRDRELTGSVEQRQGPIHHGLLLRAELRGLWTAVKLW